MYEISLLFIINSNPVILLSVNEDNNMIAKLISAVVISLIFWVISAISKSSKNKEKIDVESDVSVPEMTIDPISTYSASEIKSQKRSFGNSFFHGHREKIQIEFVDGVKGIIFHNQSKNNYYFNDKFNPGNALHYDNFTNCSLGIHYFKTTGKRLKLGYVYSQWFGKF